MRAGSVVVQTASVWATRRVCLHENLGYTEGMAEIPSSLLRFFDKEEHALGFLNGEIRFGLLDVYRTIEGSRRDETEGRVSFSWNKKATEILIGEESNQIIAVRESDQNIHCSSSSMNRYYIMCTSHPDANVKYLAEKFGPFMVRIDDPLSLLERVKREWQSNGLAQKDGARIAQVEYNKDGLLEPDPYLTVPVHYSYSQKPTSDKQDREFRYVLTCKVDVNRTWEEFLTVRVDDCSDICSLSQIPKTA